MLVVLPRARVSATPKRPPHHGGAHRPALHGKAEMTGLLRCLRDGHFRVEATCAVFLFPLHGLPYLLSTWLVNDAINADAASGMNPLIVGWQRSSMMKFTFLSSG